MGKRAMDVEEPEDEFPAEESVMDIDAHELPVMNKSHELLVWPTSPVRHVGLCRVQTPYSRDGIYHAILNGCSEHYRKQKINGYPVKFDDIVTMFRRELATIFAYGPVGERPYDRLSNGTARALAKQSPEYSLHAMQSSLLRDGFIPAHLLPFVCDTIGHDIIYISGIDRDVETFSNQTDQAILGRPTVILIYSRNHYELVGLMDADGEVDTCFKPDHPYIKRLRKRLGLDKIV